MRKTTRAIILLLISAQALVSCEKKSGNYPAIDILTLPSLTGKDFRTIYTDSGLVQLELFAPLMESYNRNDNPYTEFRKGIKVLFHDGHKDPVGSVTAKYAKYTQDKNLWELQDSVVAINEAGEKLETELLYWDEKKGTIFTDRFVKITTEDQIIQGYGLESDTRLTKRKIKNLSAIIYIKDENVPK
jgi:lipopolysaccharide export system protein LptC